MLLLGDGGENLHQMAELGRKIINQFSISADNGAKIADGEEWYDRTLQILAENLTLEQDLAKRFETLNIIG